MSPQLNNAMSLLSSKQSWRLFLVRKMQKEQLYRSLHVYDMAFKRNSPNRMRTVTAENQYQRLVESVTPLSHVSYDEQLKIKRAALEHALKKVVNIAKHRKKGTLTAAMEKAAEENNGCVCPLTDMKACPKPTEFRNKEELSIRLGFDGDRNTLGLTIGRDDHTLCVPSDYLCNIKPLHSTVQKAFKQFLNQSKFRRREPGSDGYSPNCWNSLLIRSNEEGHVMLMPELSGREITQDVINEAKCELLSFYLHESQAPHCPHSLYLQIRRDHSQLHLHGDTHLYEKVLGYKFRISPNAFFQLNTPGAEVLYTVVQGLVKACRPQILLDVGCGTGTIGILMSSLVDRVIGLDVVKQAIQDAEFNACLNGVQNASFMVGSARRLLKTFVEDDSIMTEEAVAVANPSRNGLSKKAIQRFRCCEMIKNVIFISCKPHGNALINFVDLIVPESEDHPGKPFTAVQAIGVDMFPQTIHSELVLLFQR